MNIQQLTDDALEAFWEVVVKRFPKATTGDLSPWTTFKQSQASQTAIEEWIMYNVMTQEADIVAGYRFKLFHDVNRLPDFLAPAEMTGVVTSVDDSGVSARMDQPIAGADDRGCQIQWPSPDDFARDTTPT